MTISQVTLDELPETQKLLRQTWHDTYGHLFSPEAIERISANWHSMKALTAQSQDSNTYFAVAKEQHEIVGLVTATIIDGTTIRIGRLYISPNHQRKGIGSQLLSAVITHFPQAKKIMLEVETENPKGCSFYLKKGFKKVGEQTEEVEGVKLHSAIMEKEIDKD